MDRFEERLAVIGTLPGEMQDYALIDWKTVAVATGYNDAEYAREVVTKAGVPLVKISERRKLPRWGDLRCYLAANPKRSIHKRKCKPRYGVDSCAVDPDWDA